MSITPEKLINLLDLPNEMLVKILENLSLTHIVAVRQTCSRLYQLSYSPEIMKKQVFIILDNSDNEVILNRIIEMKLTILNLKFHVSENSLVMKYLNSLGTKIRSLCFCSEDKPDLSLSFPLIECLLLSCTNLKELSFHNIDFTEWPEELNIMEWKGKSIINEMLEVLKFHKCKISDLVIHIFFNFYRSIKKLFIYFKYMDYNEAVIPLEQPSLNTLTADFLIHKIITCNKNIQKLSWLSYILDNYGLKRTQFMNLILNLRLRSVHLMNQNISEAEFKSLFSRHSLKKFKIVCCQKFNIACLRHLLMHCPELRSLILLGISSSFSRFPYFDILKALRDIGQNVKVLEFSESFCFSEEIRIEHNTADLKLPLLEHACWLSSPKTYNFNFLENCRLTRLELNGTKRIIISDVSLFLRILSAQQTTLVILKLHIAVVYDLSISSPQTTQNLYFPKLEELSIKSDTNVRRKIQGNFNFPSLKNFSSHYEDPLDDNDVELMMIGCPLLEYLKCTFVNEINEEKRLRMHKGWYFLKDFEIYDTGDSECDSDEELMSYEDSDILSDDEFDLQEE